MTRHEFELPWPPSTNRIWRRAGRHIMLDPKARAYRRLVVAKVGGVEPLAGDLRLTVDFYPPSRRRRDLGNCEKALTDALQAAGVFEDDFQIKQMRLNMCEPMPPAGLAGVVVEVI